MSTLYLIRHGQASFGNDNYDILSPLGEEQSRLLGTYAFQQNLHFDAVFSGSMKRQLDTFHHFSKAFSDPLPDLLVSRVFNEHQVTEIFNRDMVSYLQEYPQLAKLIQEKGLKHPDVKKGIMRLFFKVNTAWVQGEIDSGEYESWLTFKNRVLTAFPILAKALESNQKVALFSSGGTISILIGEILGVSDTKMAELNWQIRNSSISEVSYSKGKYFLRGFNHIAHLPDQEMVTYA